MARGPSKYTPDRVKKIIDAVRLGCTYGLASQYAGIDNDTFTNWLHRYSEFSDAVKEAEGAALVGWLAKIEQAASSGHWQAAAWKAERRYPQQYGRTVQEVQGKDGGPIEIKPVLSLTDEELDERIALALQTSKDRAAFPPRGEASA